MYQYIISYNTVAQHARELIQKSIPPVSDALQELHTNQENLKLCEWAYRIIDITIL